jgi:flagellar hook-associated protein 1 FlgK
VGLNSISSILAAANSGLRASQTRLDIVSRNVANASTEGYTRKSVDLTNLVVGGSGQGVITGDVVRNVNKALMREIREGYSIGEARATEDDFLARLELAFGAPQDETSVATFLSRLSNSFRQLTSQPDSTTVQQDVITKAQDLARSVNDLSDAIQALRLEAELAIDSAIGEINTALNTIADINNQIIQARGLNEGTADLEDKRDLLLDNLSKLIDITTYERSNGSVWVLTGSGHQLVDAETSELEFNPKSGMNASMTYAGGQLTGVEIDGNDITADIGNGKLRGLFNVRDDLLVEAQTQLDELSARIAQNFALSDLDLFDYAVTETVVTGRTATAAAAAGATTFTVSSAVGLAIGMQFRFSGHATTYEISNIAGATITFAPAAGSGTSLDTAIALGESVIFADAPTSNSIGYSTIMSVNATVEAQTWRLRDGTSAAAASTTVFDNTIPRGIVDFFEDIQIFSSGTGLGDEMTLTAYAGAIITYQGSARANKQDLLATQTALNDQLLARHRSETGVNVDRELALMIEIQNAYQASARIITVARDMYDELLNMTR